MPKLSTFDVIGIGVRHLNEITEAIPHIVKAVEILQPLLDEFKEKGVTVEQARETFGRQLETQRDD